MNSNRVVVVFEPAIPGEKLSLASQVQQVFGPFSGEDDEEHWIDTFKQRCPNRKWEFLVIDLDSPNAIPTDHTQN